MGLVSSGGATGMDFGSMNFANNIFNASSLFVSAGISMVDGVKVTAINLLDNNEISITLRRSASATSGVNASNMPPRVTVIALRAPMDLKDLLLLASQSSKMGNSSTASNNPFMMGAMQKYGVTTLNGTNSVNNLNPLSFLSDLQIGSSSVVNTNWKLAQTVRMGLSGIINSNKSTASTADFTIVTVIPFTGRP
jgi:hypothetical protein